MGEIKFGTDGWRAIIAKDYTIDNVKRVTEATAKWMLRRKMKKVVIGYDCRFGGEMFGKVSAEIFGHFGLKVLFGQGFSSTPMVSLGVVKTGADMGIVITASHNPPSYNGYKLKSAYGGPTGPKEIDEVEAMIPESPLGDMPSIGQLTEMGLFEYIDLEQMYMDHVEANFDLDAIRESNITLAYDAMFGAGQNVIKRLFPNAHLLHCEFNPSFLGQAPEPIGKNLQELSNLIKSDSKINLGLANDGDADRIGMFDENGEFVDSHHLLLLLLFYLYEYKKYRGKVIITFSVTDKMKRLAELYGCEIEVTKIGFKYIAEIMTKEDVLVGGEESGGLAVKGHIPERDGIWIGLLIMEFMAKTKKSINELIQEVYDKVGSFACERDDLHLTEEAKKSIIERFEADAITKIGTRAVIRMERIDGYKLYLSEDEWIMARPSGTEPVLRVYAEAPSLAAARKLLDATHLELKK